MPRAGTQMGWLGPTLTPGRLWPGPEVGVRSWFLNLGIPGTNKE